MALISVIMPVRNAESTLGSSIRSVQAQTHSDFELLITDDDSSDRSWEAINEFAAADERIKPERATTPIGAAKARNLAIKRARGKYVAFLDSDDMWLPTKAEKQTQFAAESASPLTYTSYYRISADHDQDAHQFRPNGRLVKAPEKLDYRAILLQDHIGSLTAMYDREVLGNKLMPDIAKRQDYALWLEILRDGHVARGMAEPLAIYRAGRKGSLSSKKLSLVPYNWHLYRTQEGLSIPRSLVSLGGAVVHSLRNSVI